MNFYLQKKKRWGQKQILVEQINVFVTSSYHASFPQKTLYHSYLNDIPNIFQNYYNFVLVYVTLFIKSALLNAVWHGEWTYPKSPRVFETSITTCSNAWVLVLNQYGMQEGINNALDQTFQHALKIDSFTKQSKIEVCTNHSTNC